ncbi:microtubule-associated protein 1A/1B, light chain 3 [Trypanosoma grayi]|uniref:microtubule-associated protein 1A/1B, light chain 3 n=1 Tax=Trypanosoma grayi TaxID=71804 RepID=UPI0004F4558B|nr:microtubule-associated protein 1A/1B, light chain 3 [Trypanosoma grayi]KEG13975.1 microtubule-associated protein 1A/1B, light chain 3 [Trypanosoma grayi]
MARSFESKYKLSNTFESRQKEALKVRERHPDRLPIICEKVDDSSIRDLDKGKFLVPADLTVGQFMMVLRKRVQMDAEEAIFVFINGSVPPSTAQISDLYAHHKDEDGFLYIKYSGEATFG